MNIICQGNSPPFFVNCCKTRPPVAEFELQTCDTGRTVWIMLISARFIWLFHYKLGLSAMTDIRFHGDGQAAGVM